MALAEADRTNIPATHAFAVSPSNSADLAHATRGLWVGGAGDVKVDMIGGETAITFVGVPAGTMLPIAVSRVYSTGTSATSIVGVY